MGEARLDLAQVLGQKGKAPGGPVTTKLFHQIVAGLEGGKHIKLGNAPSRAPNYLLIVVLVGADEHGHAVAFHQPRGHNANHAMVPAGLHDHQDSVLLNINGSHLPLLLAPGHSRLLNGLAQVLAGSINLLTLHGPLQGHPDIVGGEQINHNLRFADAAYGIDARSQAKANVFGFEGFALVGQPRHLNQGLNAKEARSRQEPQSPAHPAAVDPRERGQVGNGAQGK